MSKEHCLSIDRIKLSVSGAVPEAGKEGIGQLSGTGGV